MGNGSSLNDFRLGVFCYFSSSESLLARSIGGGVGSSIFIADLQDDLVMGFEGPNSTCEEDASSAVSTNFTIPSITARVFVGSEELTRAAPSSIACLNSGFCGGG
jgi:hypothetical protein